MQNNNIFLLALVIDIKVVKIKTSFFEIQYSCLNNGFFYCNYNIKFCLNYKPLCSNNSAFNYYFFTSYLAQLR